MARAPVLIVDDAPANLKVARVALETEGYDVCTAADGEEAWRMLADFEPCLILMDLQMPGLDGFELTRRLKSDDKRRHIPIIAVTAYAMKGDRERALAAGCDGYISKPIDPIRLPELVADHLREAERRRRERIVASLRPTILVVEDNPTTRKAIRVALESDGYAVAEAGEGRAALDWAAANHAQLVLQDLVLPDMDGLELVQKLRALPHVATVPILCLSGFLSRMDDARALKDGFSALLVKPIDPIQLLEIVRVHLHAPQHQPPTVTDPSARHVLVVDDDPLQRQLAAYHLGGAGFRVTCVNSAAQALLEAERSLPDAIVSDVLMPEMDGFELCLSLRRHPLLGQIPIVLISSHYTEASDQKLARDVGATALITRSGDWAGALAKVRETLGHDNVAPSSASAESARDAILRRTLAQLDRQMRANTRLGQQCAFQAAQLSVLAGVAEALAHRRKLEAVLGDVLAVCLDLAGISKGALYIRRHDALVPEHWIGFGAEEIAGLADFFGQPAWLDEIVASGQVRSIPSHGAYDPRSEPFLQRAGVQAALVVPVVWGPRSYGALLLGARNTDVREQEPIAFARVLGGQMGQAIGLADMFERLHASEQHVRALVDSMDRVTVVDREQRVTGMYGNALKREGIDVARIVGKPLREVLPHEYAAHQEAHQRALAGESLLYDWAVEPGSDAHYFQSAVFPVRDAEGRVHSVVRVSRDVTEQKNLQAQVMVADRMASVGMLAAGVAHEINNPLMAVLGNVQLALDAMDEEPMPREFIRESLQDILEASQRVEVIVRDLRLFSRAEEDRCGPVDVLDVLDSTLRMARNEIRHRAKLVTSYANVPPVYGNGSRLGQVFLNLLINAAQALPEGDAGNHEIRISARLDEQDRVIVEIADTGPGIPEAIRPKLFTPFVTTKPPGVGTGLGLAICRRIINMLGGEISFETELGRGTVFRVALKPERDASALSLQPPSRPVPARRRGKMLVIDDDASLRTFVRKAITQHDVVTMADAREALDRMLTGEVYDLILCDLMMPRMSGADFHAELARSRPELAARVVFMTGGAFTPAAREFLARVSPRCLEKPFEVTQLRTFINQHIA